jgi:RNase P/RNase MRP subunit p29
VKIVEVVFERFLVKVKTLRSEDQSESGIEGNVVHKYEKPVNRLDYSGSEGRKGDTLRLEVKLANLIDLSGVKIEEVQIIGKANIVDISGSKIRILDMSQMEAVHIDLSDSEIDEEKVH